VLLFFITKLLLTSFVRKLSIDFDLHTAWCRTLCIDCCQGQTQQYS
jgi:hypothetical protein